MKNIFRLFITTIIILAVSVSVGYADAGCNYLLFETNFDSGDDHMGGSVTVADTLVDNAEHGKALRMTYSAAKSSYSNVDYSAVSDRFDSGELKKVLISIDMLFEGKASGNLRFISSEQVGETTSKNGMYLMNFTSEGKFTSDISKNFTNPLNWLKYSYSYKTNTWYNFKLELDLENQTFDFWINDDVITEGTTIVTNSGEEMIDFLAARININKNSTADASDVYVYADNIKYYIPHSVAYTETGINAMYSTDTIDIEAAAIGEESAVLFAAVYEGNSLTDIKLVNAESLDDILFAQYSCGIQPGREYRFFLFNNTSDIKPLTPYWEYYSYLESDYQQIIENWRHFLLGGEPDTTSSNIRTRIKGINQYGASLQSSMNKSADATSLWGAAYTASSHLGTEYGKIYNMALAYGTQGHDLYKDETLKEDIIYALDWMYENRYGQTQIDSDKDETVENWRDIRAYNWWDWFVSAPTYLVDIMMIMNDDLTAEQIEKYFSLYDYLCTFMRTNMQSDANINSRAYARFGADVLMRNEIGIKTMLDAYPVLFAVAKTGTGMYEDYSYLKHNMIPYTGVYGTGALLDRIVKIMSITDGTVFALPSKYTKVYTGWIFNAFEPLMIDAGVMSMVRGRGVDGGNEQGDGLMVFESVLNMIDAVSDEDAYQLKLMIKRHLRDERLTSAYKSFTLPQIIKLEQIMADTSVPADPDPYQNTRIYYHMDRAVHHKADWSAGVALHSERTGNYESINQVNKNGWYTSDGMLYLYTEKNQYNASYFEYADPYKRPGTTVDSQERQLTSIASGQEYFSSKDFVGGAALDGSYAVLAMDLESFHNDTLRGTTDGGGGGDQPLHDCDLTAKKSWYMFDNEIVCLGTDINATADYEVYTTVENRKITDHALTLNGAAVEYGTEGSTNAPVYAHIEGTGGYYFPAGGNLKYRQVTNTSKFFEMWLSHGNAPESGSYAYAVLPLATAEETAAYAQNPKFEILSNTASVQAVHQKELGITGYTFWSAGTLNGVTVSAPATVMVQSMGGKLNVAVSDPTFKLDELVVTIDGEYEPDSCDSNLTVSTADGKTIITADLSDINGATLAASFVTMPDDYTNVLLFEDYEGDSAPESGKYDNGVFQWQVSTQLSVESGDTTAASAKNQGDYIHIAEPTGLQSLYYRPLYGTAECPVRANGVEISDLGKMQVSFDFCSLTDMTFNMRFYDKFSNTSATKAETLITFGKGGTLSFANSDVTMDYSLKTWYEIDTFLDFETDTYSVYIDGSPAVTNAPLTVLTECCESAGVIASAQKEGVTFDVYMDNFRIAIPK